MKCIIPKAAPVQQMLAMLFGPEFTVNNGGDASPDGAYAGIYINPEGDIIASCIADRGCAARMSAALSMLHPDVATEALAEDSLSEAMVANLYEVMNILTRLVMDDESMHLKLDTVVPVNGHDGLSTLAESGQRIDFAVSLPKYGDGVLSFVVS